MKTCSRCKTEKPVSDFPLNRNRPDGRHSHCKQCRHEYYLKHKKLECSVKGCNRPVFANGICQKHDRVLKKYGRVKLRSITDPNEIRIEGDSAYLTVRDKSCRKKTEVVIDAEDVSRIKPLRRCSNNRFCYGKIGVTR